MNNKETLEKAIQKAIGGGFTYQIHSIYWPSSLATQTVYTRINKGTDISIFDKLFAAAIWPGTSCALCGKTNEKECQGCDAPLMEESDFHLQQMVIADDPIAYLGEHL